MKELLDFLNENRTGSLATNESDQPRVRPFEFQFEEDGKFYFITSNEKPVFKQIKNNPQIEFMVIAPKLFPYVRVSGEMRFSDDIEIKKSCLENSPLAKLVFKTADNPVVEIIYVDSGEAVLVDSPSNPPKLFKF